MSGRTAALLVALLCAGLASGCGGGKETKQTKDLFVSQADVLCALVAQDLQRKGDKDPTTPAEIAQANVVLADAYGKLGKGLRKLRLPEGPDRAGAKAYVESVYRTDPALAQLRSSAKALVAAAEGTDVRALTTAANDVRSALDGFRKARADSDLLAVQYGFTVCGNLG